MSMNEHEAAIEAAMNDSQVDDDSAPNDVESDLMKAAEGMPKEEVLEPEQKAEAEEKPAEVEEKPAEADEKPLEVGEKRDEVEFKIDKAPAGWTPANREHWAGLPDGLKTQIAKREKEINTALQSTADERKLANAFTQTAQPFQAIMAAEGAHTPLQAFKGLLDTAATLRTGSPIQRAKKISDLISHYGVDIGELDNILSGQAPSEQSAGNNELEQMITKRLQPLEEVINGYKTREQSTLQANNQKTQSEIAAFGEANEFFNDVRLTMADAMDLATKQGRTMGLEEAYKFACNITPEIKQVLDTRASQNNVTQKKKAASSLSHKVGGVAGRELPQTLEGQLEALWDGGEA